MCLTIGNVRLECVYDVRGVLLDKKTRCELNRILQLIFTNIFTTNYNRLTFQQRLLFFFFFFLVGFLRLDLLAGFIVHHS